MNYILLGSLPTLVLLGCSEGGIAMPALIEVAKEDAQAPLQARAVDFVVHEKVLGDGTPQKPKFRLHAERSSVVGEGVYVLKEIQVVLYDRDRSEGPIEIMATLGRYKEGKIAHLEGDVQALVGKQEITLEDVYLEIDDGGGVGLVRTDNPVTMRKRDMVLTAESLQLYPAMNRWKVTNVDVVIQLRREK